MQLGAVQPEILVGDSDPICAPGSTYVDRHVRGVSNGSPSWECVDIRSGGHSYIDHVGSGKTGGERAFLSVTDRDREGGASDDPRCEHACGKAWGEGAGAAVHSYRQTGDGELNADL